METTGIVGIKQGSRRDYRNILFRYEECRLCSEGFIDFLQVPRGGAKFLGELPSRTSSSGGRSPKQDLWFGFFVR